MEASPMIMQSYNEKKKKCEKQTACEFIELVITGSVERG